MVTLFGMHLFEKNKAQLVFDNNLVIPLYEDKVVIGRAETGIKPNQMVEKIGNKIVVVDSEMTKRLSRNHALFKWDKDTGKYLFEDTSSYGSSVAGRSIHKGKILLANKDVINLQGLKFTILYN